MERTGSRSQIITKKVNNSNCNFIYRTIEPCRVYGSTEIILDDNYDYVKFCYDGLHHCAMFVFKDSCSGQYKLIKVQEGTYESVITQLYRSPAYVLFSFFVTRVKKQKKHMALKCMQIRIN